MTLDELSTATHRLVGLREAQEAKVRALYTEIGGLEGETTLLTHCSSALETLLKIVSMESLESVEKLVTYGLRTVFEDLALQFKVEVESKRGLQWMEPKLVDGGVEAPILDAFGGGPASVVAFLLRLLVCRRLGLAPVLFLDESFSFISEQYVDPTARLLRELADTLGVTLVLVTHHKGYLAYATRAYEAEETADGTTFVPAR